MHQLPMMLFFSLPILLIISDRVDSFIPTKRNLPSLSFVKKFSSYPFPKENVPRIVSYLSSSSLPYPAPNPLSSVVATSTSFPSSASLVSQSTKLSTVIQSQTAAEAVNAVKLLAEQRNIVLTQQEIEKIPELLIHFLTVAENDAKKRFDGKNGDLKYKTILSSYLLADCAWSTGTLQNKRLQNIEKGKMYDQVENMKDKTSGEHGLQRNYATSTFKNKNEYFLTELAIKIITNLVLQDNNVKGRDLAKIMIGFQRMGVEWENISPNDMSLILESNMNNLDGRGLSNVIWSLGSLYVRFDELSVILKVNIYNIVVFNITRYHPPPPYSIGSCPISSHLILLHPILSDPVLFYLISSHLPPPYSIGSTPFYQILSSAISSHLISTHLPPPYSIILYSILSHLTSSSSTLLYQILSSAISSHLILLYPILSDSISYYLIHPYPFQPHPTLSHPISSYPIQSCFILFNPTLFYPISSNPIPFYLIQLNPPYHIPSHPILSHSISYNSTRPIISHLIQSYPILSHTIQPALSYPIRSNPIPFYLIQFNPPYHIPQPPHTPLISHNSTRPIISHNHPTHL